MIPNIAECVDIEDRTDILMELHDKVANSIKLNNTSSVDSNKI